MHKLHSLVYLMPLVIHEMHMCIDRSTRHQILSPVQDICRNWWDTLYNMARYIFFLNEKLDFLRHRME